MEKLKLIVNGALGRMGEMAVQAIEQQNDLVLVAKNTKNDDLEKTILATNADVVVDLTTPQAVYQNTLSIINASAHPVIGTTGLTPKQIKNCQSLAKKKQCGGVIAPNFSIAALLMMKFAQTASQWLPDAEIIEMHHPKKLDAP